MSRMLCRVSVDDDFYKEYKEKKFKVPHDFKEEQPERTLETIDFFARSSEYKKYYPEFHAACKEIVDRERKNIEAYYAKKDGRKEYVAMKHDTFDEYLKDLQGIKKTAAAERAELTAKHNAAAAKWKEAQNDPSLSEFGKTSRKMDWLTADKEYKDGIADLKQRTDAGIKDVRAEFERHLGDFYGANGARIDDDVLRLFNSGIKLSRAEIDGLVEKNMHNPTMLRVIADHCDRNKIDNKAARIAGVYANAAGKNERELFNHVADLVGRVTGDDDKLAELWGAENSHFDRLSQDAVNAMNGLSVRPEAAAE